MIDTHKILAIIPARKGSKGIRNKNMRLIGKKPMIQHTMDAALNSSKLNNIILSTDDNNIIELAKNIGIQVPFKRPTNLSLDHTKISEVLIHAIEWYKVENQLYPDNILLLQPTSPFRTSRDIDCAIEQFEKTSKKSLVSATEVTQHPGDCLIKNNNDQYQRLKLNSSNDNNSGRQAYPEVLYIDGSIYISETIEFLKTQQLIGNDPEIMITEQSHAIDIDTPFDLKIAKAIYDSDEF
tara:strand:+ start:3898 stop:4611 length:714 start_codon:yes stop_codon:yes gene_type:complete